MLDVFPNAHELPRESELCLYSCEGGDLRRSAVRAEEIPGIEAGEVLEGSEEFVAADGGGDELEVVRNGRVVN